MNFWTFIKIEKKKWRLAKKMKSLDIHYETQKMQISGTCTYNKCTFTEIGPVHEPG